YNDSRRQVYVPASRRVKGVLARLAARAQAGITGKVRQARPALAAGRGMRGELRGWIEAAGLVVGGRDDVKPARPKASDPTDPLHRARAVQRVRGVRRLRTRRLHVVAAADDETRRLDPAAQFAAHPPPGCQGWSRLPDFAGDPGLRPRGEPGENALYPPAGRDVDLSPTIIVT
ncbi:hypothetical protein CF642_38105, partial [Burkholderia pseudomallei]